jgi:hypothetical protein
MNAFSLKIIALTAMFIDHIGAVLVPYNTRAYWICRIIGRIAFPIFCFLLVEGFYHTKDVKKYLRRLGIFALISELPFDLLFSLGYGFSSLFKQQNVFFTLFLGLLVLYLMSISETKYGKNTFKSNLLSSLAIIAGCAAALLLAADYSFMGILLIVTFYIFRSSKYILTMAVVMVTYFSGYPIEVLAVISMIFILRYNGNKGPQGNKYFYYAFYPVHMLCIYFISLLPVFH